jgi:hypothetical protein
MFIYKNFRIFNKYYEKRLAKWYYINCVRPKSSAEPKTKAYSHTILLPKTEFPARSNNAKKEEIQNVCYNNPSKTGHNNPKQYVIN